MPVPGASLQVDFLNSLDEARSDPPRAPGRYEPRFRVVTRPTPTAPPTPPRGNPVHRAMALAVFPAVFLLLYVMFWTMAMRGGYYRDRLEVQIETLRIEQAELEAEKQRLRAPGLIFSRAGRELGMRQAERQEYRVAPAGFRQAP